MNIIQTGIQGLFIIEPVVFKDERGYFFESYNQGKFKEAGINTDFVQDNESKSSYGVIRGLHYQIAPHAQIKLVRAIKGAIYDVAVDIRKNSPTFGKWFGTELTADNKRQMFVPKGFAHGFSVLSEEAIVAYKCDELYRSSSERGISYNDPALNIDWKVPNEKAIVSSKDKILTELVKAESNFIY